MNRDNVYRMQEDYMVFQAAGSEKKFFLCNPKNGDIWRLNETTYDILSLVDGLRNVGQIIWVLQNRYLVDAEELAKDMETLILQCIHKGILIDPEKEKIEMRGIRGIS